MKKVIQRGQILRQTTFACIGFKRRTNQQRLYEYVANVCGQHKEGKNIYIYIKDRVFRSKCSERALSIFT